MKSEGHRHSYKWALIPLFLLLFVFLNGAGPCYAEESLNYYYRYPFSVGVNYHPFTSVALANRKAALNEISITARVPLPFLPVLQPFVFGGIISADSDEKDEPTVLGGALNDEAVMPDYNQDEIWDHKYWFGALGAGYAHRISKEFEIGADLYFGLEISNFPKRFVIPAGEWYTVGELGLLTGFTGKLALNPSYNLSIVVTPSVRYNRSLGNFHDFDGLYFGVGFSAHFRFGKDPDAPQREISSIQFVDISIPALFSAMQSYYAKNPIGTVTITNKENRTLEDVEIFFNQAGFMDSPTPAGSVGELEGGETIEVPLLASFNQEVFSIEGITPLTGEVITKYSFAGRRVEQKQPVSYDLYDKTSIVWDDDAKAAAFITPADSALRNYTSFIRQTCRDETIPLYNDPIQFAMQSYHALGELGMLYQVDPTLPFTEVKESTVTVDSISLSRETLKRITGDCDDLTVLFCSLLETVGIESGFITIPGHIFAVFNTKKEAAKYKEIHVEREMIINLDGELWVPVEITMIGRANFLEAWRRGSEEWYAYEEDPGKRGFFITRDAQKLYRAVGLRETDLGLQYGEETEIIKNFNKDLDSIVQIIVKDYRTQAEEGKSAKEWNKLGIVYAQFKRYNQANEAFFKALSINPDYLGARINLGNVLFLQQKHEKALEAYQKALSVIEARSRGDLPYITKLLLNISRTYYLLNDYDRAKAYFARAEETEPDAVKEHSYLADVSGGGDGTARAAEDRDIRYGVLFAEGEE